MVALTPVPPAPSAVPAAPLPRVVWQAPEPAHLRISARDWDDGHPSTYSVEALHHRHWQPATGEETMACLFGLARWLDDVERSTRA